MNFFEQFFYQIEPQSNVIILMYHGFTDKTSHDGIENYHGKHLNIRKFEEQIVYLKQHYHIISLPELAVSYTAGNKLSPRPVVITMDDGYRSNYTLAFPVLKKYEAPAAVFLTTDFIDKKAALWVDRLEYAIDRTQKSFIELNLDGRICHFDFGDQPAKINADKRIKAMLKPMPLPKRDHMVHRIEEYAQQSLSLVQPPEMYAPLEWGEIRAMQSSGLITIGGHTCSHMILTNCSDEEMHGELALSKKRIEEMTQQACRDFSYPNGQKGNFNGHTKAALIKLGFQCGLTTVIGTNDAQSDRYAFKRLNVHNSGDLAGFKRTLSSPLRFLRAIRNKVGAG